MTENRSQEAPAPTPTDPALARAREAWVEAHPWDADSTQWVWDQVEATMAFQTILLTERTRQVWLDLITDDPEAAALALARVDQALQGHKARAVEAHRRYRRALTLCAWGCSIIGATGGAVLGAWLMGW